MTTSCEEQVDRYLRTGRHEHFYPAWPGSDFLARAQNGHAALRAALVAEVRSRAGHATIPAAFVGLDLDAFTRARVAPMVRGLFPRAEQALVLDVLCRSVVFLTPENIEGILRETHWNHTAWCLANLYLASVDAALLGADSVGILGLSEETTCYISMKYFGDTDRFADYVVHEAAHVFHNCKRHHIGLPETRRREWLLPIHFAKREVFAYGCEVYSRLLSLGKNPAARRALVSELEPRWFPLAGDGEAEECLEVLRSAVEARNGWKRLLEHCAYSLSRRRAPRGPDAP